jgi:putative oxidoreductase
MAKEDFLDTAVVEEFEALNMRMGSSPFGVKAWSGSWAPHGLLILRLVAGFTFSLHGYQKLFGLFGGMGPRGAAAFPSPMWVAGCLETFGGFLIALGLFTVPVAFILCGEMAVAYFMQHFPRGFFPIRNGGELAVLYCFIFLFLAFSGPGPFSLDALLRRKA